MADDGATRIGHLQDAEDAGAGHGHQQHGRGDASQRCVPLGAARNREGQDTTRHHRAQPLLNAAPLRRQPLRVEGLVGLVSGRAMPSVEVARHRRQATGARAAPRQVLRPASASAARST